MKKYTKEEKQAYQKSLRNRWLEIKKSVDEKKRNEIEAILAEHGLDVSPYSFAFTQHSMRQNNYDGVPYLDCKTFVGWKDRGFIVKKGEHSKINGIVWLRAGNKETKETGENDSDKGYLFPKMYALFHRSQVEEMELAA